MVAMGNKKGIVINALLFASLIVGYFIVMKLNSQAPARYLSFESDVFNIELEPLAAGREPNAISLRSFRGQNVVLHLWASWCDACEADTEKLNRLAQEFSQSSVRVVGIVTNETREQVEKSGKLSASRFSQYLDSKGAFVQAMGFKTLPHTLLVRADGEILMHVNRALSEAHIESLEKSMRGLP